MKSMLAFIVLAQAGFSFAAPLQTPLYSKYFDVQGHRGGRGGTIENSLPSFAWGLIDGVTTLELDNGVTKDGVVVVWHDEQILATKCVDTQPAFKSDPDFPYVGKYIANLTLAQVKTLDCGSQRLVDYPLQLTYPDTKISTLRELFAFASCADPNHEVLWNIESKINPQYPNTTLGVNDFVEKQYAEFIKSGYSLSQITFQSFDWRTLVAMKAKDSEVITSALAEYRTIVTADNSTSVWLAGLRVQDFPGATLGEQIANAAKKINADVLSPAAISSLSKAIDPTLDGYVAFTTKEMIAQAHKHGMAVWPWTVNRMNIADQLLEWGVDGIITDYPYQMRNFVEHTGRKVAPQFSRTKVLQCLDKHLKKQQQSRIDFKAQ